MTAQPGDRPYVVIAEFEVKSDRIGEFLALARFDAERSVADEPGCRQFDVVQPELSPGNVVFYEVYDSRAAFEAHMRTPHFARFMATFPDLIVAERDVRFASRHYP